MADITIDVRKVGYSDGNNIDTTGSTSTTNFLKSTLDKLTSSIEKLNVSISKLSSTENKLPSVSPKTEPNPQEHNIFRNLGTILGASAGIAMTTAIARIFNNQANAIMGRAQATGQFLTDTLSGNANAGLGNYVSSLYTVEKARKIGNNNAIYESLYGFGGSVLGAVTGGLAGDGNPLAIKAGAAAGGGIGASIGKEMAAFKNYPIEIQMQFLGALNKRYANAANSEWQTDFSRWETPADQSSLTLASSKLTGGNAIKVNLSKAFEQKYAGSQNYDAILNGIVPYMNTNPLSSKAGDLDKLAQTFLKSGIAVQDFGKATLQATQYQQLGAKSAQEFADQYQQAHKKFGAGFTLATSQTALSLMMMGYNGNQANSLAYQAQFNSGMQSSISAYNNQGVSSFYLNKALYDATGVDINASNNSGHFVGTAKAKAELQKEMANYHVNDPKTYGDLMTVLNAGNNVNFATVGSWLQNLAPTNLDKSKAGTGQDKGPGQQVGLATELANGINAANVTITATNVSIINKGPIERGIEDVAQAAFNHNLLPLMKDIGPSILKFFYAPTAMAKESSPSRVTK